MQFASVGRLGGDMGPLSAHDRHFKYRALSFGLEPGAAIDMEVEPFEKKVLFKPDDPNAAEFLALIHSRTVLTSVLNELSRAMGSTDFYPFVICNKVVAKLQPIHLVISQQPHCHPSFPLARPACFDSEFQLSAFEVF